MSKVTEIKFLDTRNIKPRQRLYALNIIFS